MLTTQDLLMLKRDKRIPLRVPTSLGLGVQEVAQQDGLTITDVILRELLKNPRISKAALKSVADGEKAESRS